MIICMAMVEAQIYFLRHMYIYMENIASIKGTNYCLDHCRKVFTTGQARVNPKRYVIKCMAADKFSITHMAF